METLFCDTHIHSCLSPCGDNDMTPANICGMAAVKGLQLIAVTDHNAAGNLPTAQKCAEAYGLLLIPGIEITTAEEVHMLGYFPDVPTAVEFGDFLREHLPVFSEAELAGLPAGSVPEGSGGRGFHGALSGNLPEPL